MAVIAQVSIEQVKAVADMVEIVGARTQLRKSGARGFVVSLSGGVDSACCAVLVAHMYAAAKKELGDDGLRRRLDELADRTGADELMASSSTHDRDALLASDRVLRDLVA